MREESVMGREEADGERMGREEREEEEEEEEEREGGREGAEGLRESQRLRDALAKQSNRREIAPFGRARDRALWTAQCESAPF